MGSKKSSGANAAATRQPQLKDFIPAYSNFGGITVTFGPGQGSSRQVPVYSGGTAAGQSNVGIRAAEARGTSGPRVQTGTRTVTSRGQDEFLVSSDPERQALIERIQAAFGAQAEGLQPFINQVQPGFGALTQAGVQAIQTARERSISDLRGGLQQRRLSGSSFANDTIARAEREFSDAEASFRAETKLQELDTSIQLFNQQSALRTEELNVGLTELDKQSSIGLSLLRGVQAEFGASSRAAQQSAAQLAAANAQGAGDFLGTLLGIGAFVATGGQSGVGSLLA